MPVSQELTDLGEARSSGFQPLTEKTWPEPRESPPYKGFGETQEKDDSQELDGPGEPSQEDYRRREVADGGGSQESQGAVDAGRARALLPGGRRLGRA